MCGRFALGLPYARIVQAVHAAQPDLDLDDRWLDQDAFHPRYNIAPRSRSPVLRRRNRHSDQDYDSNHNSAFLQTMKWGLVPHWSKHEDTSLNTINAKAENLVEGTGMWNSIKGKKRCAIPCQGYYEWLKKGKDRLPHFTKYKSDKIMFIAGLYDCVTLEGQIEPLWTYTIVTTDANKQLTWLHDRQPVILSTKEELEAWLDTSSDSWTSALSKIVLPYNDSKSPLECYQVPKEVGKVGEESSTFIEPVSQRKDGIQAMFARQKSQGTEPSSSKDKVKPTTNSPIPTKRKHEVLTISDDESDAVVQSAKKKGRADEDLDNVRKSPSTLQHSRRKKVTSPSKPAPANNSSITNFFGKK